MMTFKDLKKLVELPSYKEQRVPTAKALEVSGVPVVAEKILENHGSISVYQNGYVIYRAHHGGGQGLYRPQGSRIGDSCSLRRNEDR